MRAAALVFSVSAALVACGATSAPGSRRPSGPTSGADIAIVAADASPPASGVTDEPDPVVGFDPSIEARLATFPAPPVPWTTRIGSMTVAEMASVIAFEREHTNVAPVEMQCANGTTARVGLDGPWDPHEARSAADGCTLEIGEVIACRMAVREHPCTLLGATLPECRALNACFDDRITQLVQELTSAQRMEMPR